MDTLITKAGELLLSQGLAGAIIVFLGLICWRIFNLYTEAQEKRITESTRAAEALEANRNALERLSDILQARKAA